MLILRSTLLPCIFCAALAAQPMGGTYTIDGSLPTGGTNFASFTEAAEELMTVGVSGTVEFTVVAAGGPYGGFHLGPVVGTSPTNRVIFRGVGFPALVGTYPLQTPGGTFHHTIHLYAGSYSGFGPGLTGTGPSHVTLEGLDVSNGLGNGHAAIAAMGCSDVVIDSCRIHDSDSAIGVAFSPGTVIEGCEIQDISPPAAYTGPWRGAAVMVAASCHDSIVRGNRMHDCSHVGMYLGGQFDATGIPFTPSNGMLVANNMLWNVTGSSAALTDFGVLTLFGAPGAVLAHNSISVPPGTSPGLRLGTTAAAATVVNNIVKHDGAGACIAFASASSAVPANLDDNLYDPGPLAWIGAVGATSYLTLADWQNWTGQESGTLHAPAGFVSAQDLHIAQDAVANLMRGQTVGQVERDIDGNDRDALTPCRGADEFVLTLKAAQPNGPGTGVFVSNLSLDPGHVYYNLFSIEPCPSGPGLGPLLGLCASNPVILQSLIDQFLLPVGAEPFHFQSTATTQAFGPYMAGPATVDGVCFDFTGGVLGAISEVERLVIL